MNEDKNPYRTLTINYPKAIKCHFCEKILLCNGNSWKDTENNEFHFDCFVKILVNEQVDKRIKELIEEIKK